MVLRPSRRSHDFVMRCCRATPPIYILPLADMSKRGTNRIEQSPDGGDDYHAESRQPERAKRRERSSRRPRGNEILTEAQGADVKKAVKNEEKAEPGTMRKILSFSGKY